jgi:5-methylcytosine-specific restriction endonuclease McrA
VSEPLVPPEVDLRDFPYMLLDVRWVRDNHSFWRMSDAEFRVSFLLLAASWHQVPAASVPDDDRFNAHLTTVSLRKWRSTKAAVLKDWVHCSDGRFYHPVIAPRALDAWRVKLRQMGRIIRRVEMESGLWQARRMEVFRRDNFTCRYCGARNGKLECDHVHPLSRGGNSEVDNLVTACKPCNRSKAAKTIQEWVQ